MQKTTVDFVIKISKYCNLRCKYCYEYNFLSDKTKITDDQLEQLFLKCFEYAKYREDVGRLNFIWHGGEPFMLSGKKWFQILSKQKDVASKFDIEVSNNLQTNLTILTEDHIEFIKSNDVNLGVSFDVMNENRIGKNNRETSHLVLSNMQKLQDNDIEFGVISVLSRSTVGHEDLVFNFFQETGLSFRILPFFETAGSDQELNAKSALSVSEIISSLKVFYDLYEESDRTLTVFPLRDWEETALASINKEVGKKYYSRRYRPSVFMVDTDGEIYNYDKYYGMIERSLGNIFEKSLVEILNDVPFIKSCAESEQKLAMTCLDCSYYGLCTGYTMSETHYNDRDVEGFDNTCQLDQKMINYIVSRTIPNFSKESLPAS